MNTITLNSNTAPEAVVKVEASSVRRLSLLPHKNASQKIDMKLMSVSFILCV